MGKKRMHFGVLFSTIDNSNQHKIFNGINEYAATKDIHLTAYIGTYQTTNFDMSSHFDACFETIKNSRSLDGLILFSGFCVVGIGLEKYSEYVAQLPKRLPLVSVSLNMPGIPSIMVDNVSGVYNTVDHLIKYHGKRRIVFVKGPDGHFEAEERLIGYKNALADNGLPYDARYVFPGNFSEQCGHDAITALYEVSGLPFDAMVGSNDRTAIGALNQLKLRNIPVPSRVAVTGFDDDTDSASFIPSISTVRQDFHQIGVVSAEALYKQIKGERVEAVTYIAPMYTARQSCGCLENQYISAEKNLGVVSMETESLLSFARRHFVSLFRDVPLSKIDEWVTALVDKIKEKPFNRVGFLYLFDEILISYDKYSQDFSVWLSANNTLTMGVEFFNREIENVHAVMATLISATTLINDTSSKGVKINEFNLRVDRLNLRRVTSALILVFDVDSMAKEIFELLPTLSINTALIGLYHNPIKSDESDTRRTVATLIGFDGETRFNMKHNHDNPILFSDYATIKTFDLERERRVLFFIPLFFEDEELGVILLPYDHRVLLDAYETLRVNISAAVKGAELISKIQTISITDDLTGLLNRRGFFQHAYARLQHLRRESGEVPVVLFMDMDGLKFINDIYGHNEGDRAISVFSKILRDSLRKEDIIGRMGGDEFIVLSSVKQNHNYEQVIDRIRVRLNDYNGKNAHPYKVTGSIGGVVLESATVACFEAAIIDADNVLYEEKKLKKEQGLSRA